MTQRSPAQLMRGFFADVWNARAPDQVAAYMAPDVVNYAVDEAGGHLVGHAPFQEFLGRFLGNFSNIHFTMDDVMESGDSAAARWHCTLTHTGPGLGVPPTGKTLTIRGMTFLKARDGFITEGWNEWDRAALATQLGLLVPA